MYIHKEFAQIVSRGVTDEPITDIVFSICEHVRARSKTTDASLLFGQIVVGRRSRSRGAGWRWGGGDGRGEKGGGEEQCLECMSVDCTTKFLTTKHFDKSNLAPTQPAVTFEESD